MSFEAITVEKVDAIATITMNRPEALNAITRTMLKELKSAVDAASSDDEVGLIVLTGAGRAFSAGVDLKELGELKLENGGIGGSMDDPARALIQAIQKIPKVVIAKINGFCFTGALEIALVCDLIVCADEAKLGDTHAKWGLRPSWGMSARLPNAIGRRKARELSFTARTFSGAEAAEWGLANRSVPLEKLDEAVKSLADEILLNSRDSVGAYKVLYNKGGGRTEKKALQFEEEKIFTIRDTNERLAEFLK